jgi:hypothetical protein
MLPIRLQDLRASGRLNCIFSSLIVFKESRSFGACAQYALLRSRKKKKKKRNVISDYFLNRILYCTGTYVELQTVDHHNVRNMFTKSASQRQCHCGI